MTEQIYFGDVEIIHIHTGQTRTLKNRVFKCCDTFDCGILKEIPAKERPDYRIKRYRTDTAKVIGETNI